MVYFVELDLGEIIILRCLGEMMFIDKLDSTQQGILLDWARKIIEADGVIDSMEQVLFDQVRRQCAQEVVRTSVELEELSKYFSLEASKKYFLLEVIGFCYVDGEYHEDEKRIVQSISKSLGILDEELSFMEQWVEEQIGLMSQINVFIGE